MDKSHQIYSQLDVTLQRHHALSVLTCRLTTHEGDKQSHVTDVSAKVKMLCELT